MRAAGFAGVLVVVGALAGCQVDNTPTAYVTTEQGTIVQTNFLATCMGTYPNAGSTTTVLASKDVCQCMYGVFEDSVPFNDDAKNNNPDKYPNWGDAPTFQALDKELQTDPNQITKLPSNIQDLLTNCGKEQLGPGTTAKAS